MFFFVFPCLSITFASYYLWKCGTDECLVELVRFERKQPQQVFLGRYPRFHLHGISKKMLDDLNTHIVQDIEDNSPSIDSNDNGDTDTPVQKETILEIQTKTADKTEEYMVLARKYRPMDFDSLIGQDALVRTLSNALKVGRVAQAFMLTGVRGVGKTTTARIIAKALNCDNVDKNGNPPIKPCGTCSNCTDIAGDRHVDVLEMDAASNTGIDDIREIIESAKYSPSVGRYKIFILDEVHMLSKSAFNGLLKTLEEPPAHVKFIFATTEIRKVPVTVLSRCQKFDLRRISIEQLFDHYKRIAGDEGYSVADDALRIIARSADGSVRDGLSILDQAIALSDGGEITGENVTNMLGLSDRQGIYDLYEHICKGDAEASLKKVGDLYETGANPVVVAQDLLDVTWWLTRLKMTPSLKTDISTPEIEKKAGGALSDKLSTPALSRNWQILMKGLGEIQSSDRAMMTLEMVIIRLIFASELPTPEAIVKKLLEAKKPATQTVGGGNNSAPITPITSTQNASATLQIIATQKTVQDTSPQAKKSDNAPADFDAVVSTMYKKSPILAEKLRTNARLVSFQPPKITLQLDGYKGEEVRELQSTVRRIFGQDWVIERVENGGEKTIQEQKEKIVQDRLDEADNLALVKSVKTFFPNAEIHKVENI